MCLENRKNVVLNKCKSLALRVSKFAIKKLPLKRSNENLVSKITEYVKEPKTPILIYHSVESKSKHKSVSKNIHNVKPKSFKRQLTVLKKNYDVVFVDEILRRLKKGKPVGGLAAVTFDDGYKSVLENALPILKNLDIPATWYLSTKLITEKSFWRDKVRFIINTEKVSNFLAWLSKKNVELSGLKDEDFYWKSKDPDTVNSKTMEKMTSQFLENVVSEDVSFDRIYADKKEIDSVDSNLIHIGNHTHSHYVLSSLSKKEQKKEVNKTKKILESYNAKKSSILSVPFGGKHTFNKDTKEVCRELGYEGVLTSSGENISSAVGSYTYENDRLPKLMRFMPSNNNPWFLVYS